jgi:hypothetical protein
MDHVNRSMQLPPRVMAEVGEPVWLPEAVVARFSNEADAFAWCWSLRCVKAMTLTEAARHLGTSKSHLSLTIAGKKYPRWDMRIAFQRLCGN